MSTRFTHGCLHRQLRLGQVSRRRGTKASICSSSLGRLAPNTMPTMAKSGANYMNSQLIKMEAVANGYARHCIGRQRLRQRRLWRERIRGSQGPHHTRRWATACCQASRGTAYCTCGIGHSDDRAGNSTRMLPTDRSSSAGRRLNHAHPLR